jgi:hypothetical protein
MIRVQELFRALDSLPGYTWADEDLRMTCPACGVDQALSAAPAAEDKEDTVYTCKNGCQPIVVVSPVGPAVGFGGAGGRRFGDWLVRNVSDLRAMGGGVTLWGKPAALDGVDPGATQT